MADAAARGFLFGRTSRRLSVQYSILYMALVLLVFLFAYLFSRHEMQEWAQDRMHDHADALQSVFEDGGEQALIAGVVTLAGLNTGQSRIFALFDEGGSAIAGPLTKPPSVTSRSLVPAAALGLTPDPESEVSGYWMRIDRIGPYTLVQGTGDEVVFELLEALVAALIVGFAALLGLGLHLGSRVGRLTEVRVSRISNVLQRASGGDLSARIGAGGRVQDDLGLVEAKIDEALAQIEDLLVAQRQISVDVAHDLRSPLQRLRQRLELLSPKASFETDKAEGLQAIDEIEHTFNALLTIADLEHGKSAFDLTDVPVCPMLQDLADLYAEAAETAGMTLDVDIPEREITLRGNRSLLLQMLGNLIENATKHCPGGTRIEVSVSSNGGRAAFTVRDDGPGMSETFLPHAFDRFSREDPSRQIPGNGLGLSMVRAIARGHGATVTLTNLDPGLSVVVSGFTLSG